LDPLILILLIISIGVAVGNNMGVISGPTSGSRIIKESHIMVLGVVGLSLGFLIEGGKMTIETSMSYWDTIILFVLAICALGLLTFGGFITSITCL